MGASDFFDDNFFRDKQDDKYLSKKQNAYLDFIANNGRTYDEEADEPIEIYALAFTDFEINQILPPDSEDVDSAFNETVRETLRTMKLLIDHRHQLAFSIWGLGTTDQPFEPGINEDIEIVMTKLRYYALSTQRNIYFKDQRKQYAVVLINSQGDIEENNI